MQYSPEQQECLNLMGRTNFKSIPRDEIVSLIAKIRQLNPTEQQEVIKQFPEFAALIKKGFTDYKNTIEAIIKNEEKITNHSIDEINQILDNSHKNYEKFLDMAKLYLTDCSKCLNNPNLSAEAQKEILDREERIIKISNQKEIEMRQENTNGIEKIEKISTESRKFKWGLLKNASYFMIGSLILGIGFVAGIEFMPPKK